jgi:radical SAM protein with 4Fe4S-binding SPASM domain
MRLSSAGKNLYTLVYWLTHLRAAFPEHIFIQTNNRCTRKCSFCWYGLPDAYVPDHVMSDLLFKKIIGDLSEINYAGRISLFEINEPLTDPLLVERVRYVKEELPDCWQLVATNGDLLTELKMIALLEAGLDYLVINSYSFQNYQRSERLLRTMSAAHRSRIIHNACLSPSFAKDNRAGNLPQIEMIKRPLHEACGRVNHLLYIKPDGTVVCCVGDFFNKNVVGNVNEDRVLDVWFGKRFRFFRKSLNRGNRKVSALCEKCNVGAGRTFYDRDSIEKQIKMRNEAEQHGPDSRESLSRV